MLIVAVAVRLLLVVKGLALLPLPPPGVAVTRVDADACVPPPAVVEAVTPLAGAVKIFPTLAQNPL